MSPKLKFALIRRCSDRGFALPIAIGIGFVFLLIAATLVMRSQGDQITASAQKATARSLGTAETGITRVQSLLNKYGILASTTLIDIPANTTPPTTVSSWKQVYLNSTPSTCSASGTTTEIEGYRLNQWKTLSDGSKFKITEYTYKPNSTPSNNAQIIANVTIPASGSVALVILPSTYLVDGASVDGQLQGVQGTLKRIGSIYTFTRLLSGTALSVSASVSVPVNFFPATTPGIATLKAEGQTNDSTATSNLEVNIPVEAGEISRVPIPGLWLNSEGMPGGQTVQGNILLNDCSLSISSTTYQAEDSTTHKPYIDPSTGQPYKTVQTTVSFPDLPSDPGINTLLFSKKTTITLPDIASDTASTKNGQTVYEYSVSNIPAGANITITPGQKVILYLSGNIEKTADISHQCPRDGSGNLLSGCAPTDFKIFGSGSSGSYLCLNGNNHIDAFIFAPKYSAGVAGGGHSGGFYGSLWVNDFQHAPSCGSSSSHTVVFQAADWASLGLSPKNLPPKIAPITSWQRQEIP